MAVDYNDLLYEKAQKEYDDLIAELKELPSEQVIESHKGKHSLHFGGKSA